jgi:hypothetical protein
MMPTLSLPQLVNSKQHEEIKEYGPKSSKSKRKFMFPVVNKCEQKFELRKVSSVKSLHPKEKENFIEFLI